MGKVGLDAFGDACAKGRIGQDYIDLLAGANGVVFSLEAVGVMPVGNLDAVEDEVGEAEDIGDRLVFPSGDGVLEEGLVVEVVNLVLPD